MSLLFETIKIDHGHPVRIAYHQKRMNRAFAEWFPGIVPPDVREILKQTVLPIKDVWKCRLQYDEKIRELQLNPYIRKKITGFNIVINDEVIYDHKWVNRSHLERMLISMQPGNEAIIVKNKLICDTTFSNIAFFDGHHWLTPSKPLLKGTHREFLIDRGLLIPEDIGIDDLSHFVVFRLINAMLDFSPENDYPVEMIKQPDQ